MTRPLATVLVLSGILCFPAAASADYDVLIRGGTVYDGSGAAGRRADVAIEGDRIAAVGNLSNESADVVIDARGMAVAPGFINMLSWAPYSLLHDGRGQSDIRQGVTLEVFGEGWSMGPLNEAMRRDEESTKGDLTYDIAWTTLAEYLRHAERKGVSCNIASFVGASSVRIHELGYENRPPTEEELARMKDLVRREMEEGALGVASALIYAPAFYAKTPELVELAKAAGEYDGLYVSHLRSEGNRLLEAVDEFLTIVREANVAGEIYHLKAAGRENWSKLPEVYEKIEAARAAGVGVTADMYCYDAAATGLSAAMPPWVQEGGYERWRDRLREPATRTRVAQEMTTRSDDWENLLLMSGSPDKVLLIAFNNADLKHLTGKTLGEVARQRRKSPEETAMDLVIEDGSRVECVYFLMNEDDVKRNIALPWVSFCSDAASLAPEGAFLKSNPHPRAYGNFARLLGKYVRDEKVISLEAAIHRLTAFPAATLGIRGRGSLKPGYFADVVVFDPATIQDHATFEQPHQYSTGVRHVFVNGVQVLKEGEHTGATPGRAVWGPGRWRRKVSGAERSPLELTEEARRIHEEGFVFDGHNDLPWEVRKIASSSFEKLDIAQRQEGKFHTDIPRLREGNVGAQYWSVYVPAETRKSGKALLQTLEQIDLVHAMVKRYPTTFELALTADDVERIRGEGKIASLIGVEGGHSIEDSLAVLRQLHERGARYMTLTHSDTLAWADSATDDPKHGGLSSFGEEVVQEMNRLGMLVDLSHVSVETMEDALRVSRAPVIFSHSSARAIADHPRNVPDHILRRVAENRGVVMVNFYSGFVHPVSARKMLDMFAVGRKVRAKFPDDEAEYDKAMARWRAENPIEPGTVHDVVDHIDHIVRVAGIDHVGLGGDFDGVTKLPKQLEDVSKYPFITQELLNRDYTAEEIHKILGGNALRVFREAGEVAQQLQRTE